MQMMIVMMMMVISHIGSSEEIDVLSTDETTCSNDAEQVQVLVRELEATQARLALRKTLVYVDRVRFGVDEEISKRRYFEYE